MNARHAARFAALFLATLTVAFLSCRRPVPEGTLVISDHETRFRITVAGIEREGFLHVPVNHTGAERLSLMYALHGANQSGESFSGMGFNRLADELGFIVVYPNGIGRRWDSSNDLAFFIELTKALEGRYAIDPRRIYATGISAGAIEDYELASLAPGLFAAIAPVAGTAIEGSMTGSEVPTSVLAVHARDDPEVPFSGVREWGIPPFAETVARWRRVNGGPAGTGVPPPDWVPIPERARTGRGETFLSAHGVTGTLWRGSGADTATLVFDSGGHVWPARASEYIADFFYNHPARGARVELDAESLPNAVRAGDPLTLRARCSPESAIEKVAFFANDLPVGEATRAPFAVSWKPQTVGLNRLRAEARTKAGETVRTTFESFTLAAAPSAPGVKGQSAASLITPVSCRSSSNEAADIEAPCAIDRDFFTRWSSDWTDDEWLTLDLGAPRKVSGVTIFWEIAWGAEYAIELSVDGTSWQRAAYVREGSGGVESLPFAPTRARYVRFRGIKRGTEWGYSFWELLVHGE
jgi:poly(3-hydroxybutyrate) depolymerase